MNPYDGLPEKSFWRTGVAAKDPLTIEGLYEKKFEITSETKIATAGSCFAQHISKRLRKNGYNVLDLEPPPPGLADNHCQKFGYNIYSARYGNIYTTRQLLQLTKEALGEREPLEGIWQKDQRFYDAFRPGIEPEGLESENEVIVHRRHHLKTVKKLITTCDLFIFTLGLTEAWQHNQDGSIYPIAPGIIAGQYQPEKYQFVNFKHQEVLSDFIEFYQMIKKINPNCRFLLTVSPVPLTATADTQHVLCATTYSKSVLRAVAGQLYQEFDDIDYFPSYEIIASTWSRGFFYQSNLRSVSPIGVETVMRIFETSHPPVIQTNSPEKMGKNSHQSQPQKKRQLDEEGDSLVCEEVLLEAFAK